jgi:Rrf2 family protein
MMRFGKTAQTAISVMSLLAEHYGDDGAAFSSAGIAAERELTQPLVAKILVTLSTAKLVDGARGPGGGYWLARAPREIALYDIVSLFERADKEVLCPFGPNWCGNGDPCPMHDALTKFGEEWDQYLRTTTLAIFQEQQAPKSRAGGKRAKQHV